MANPITMASRVERVVGYANTMADLYVELDQNVAIFESFATQELEDCLRQSFGANAFNSLVNMVITDVVRSSWALMLDTAERSPSIRNVWALASRADLLPVLRERFIAMASAKAGGRSFVRWSSGSWGGGVSRNAEIPERLLEVWAERAAAVHRGQLEISAERCPMHRTTTNQHTGTDR